MRNQNLQGYFHSKNLQFYYHSKQDRHSPIKPVTIGEASLKIQVYLQEAIRIINSSFCSNLISCYWNPILSLHMYRFYFESIYWILKQPIFAMQTLLFFTVMESITISYFHSFVLCFLRNYISLFDHLYLYPCFWKAFLLQNF